ncbi:hypothetical protein EDB89DRAFT_1976548, partial [Lactarius sanguifluus]
MRVSLITVSLATRASRAAITAESLLLGTCRMTILCRYKYIRKTPFACTNPPVPQLIIVIPIRSKVFKFTSFVGF